jgi:hypothetical protein
MPSSARSRYLSATPMIALIDTTLRALSDL